MSGAAVELTVPPASMTLLRETIVNVTNFIKAYYKHSYNTERDNGRNLNDQLPCSGPLSFWIFHINSNGNFCCVQFNTKVYSFSSVVTGNSFVGDINENSQLL